MQLQGNTYGFVCQGKKNPSPEVCQKKKRLTQTKSHIKQKENETKRYNSVEILEAKGINRIVCANLLVKLERSIDYYRLRISTWPGKPVFIFICVRVKKHNLKPPVPTPPPEKNYKK